LVMWGKEPRERKTTETGSKVPVTPTTPGTEEKGVVF